MDWLIRHRRPIVGSLLAAIVLGLTAIAAIGPRDDEPEVEAAETADSTTSTTMRPSTTRADQSTTTTTTTSTTEAPTTSRASTSAPAPTPAPTSSSTTTTTTEPLPPYRSSISPVTAEQLGSSYTPDMGCAEPAELRAVDVTHWGYDGAVHRGRLIVHSSQAQSVVGIFGDLYAVGFPVQRIVPVDAYGADDQASMRDNNTSAYNCRYVAGTSTLSNHAFGQAVDVNPLHNPYVKGSTVDPPEGAPWADRSRQDPGMIHADDAVVRAFGARGWAWGGYWSNPDYQHFDV